MSSRSYPLRIPDNLIELAEARAKEERTDRATALRQLLYAGAEDYVVELLKREQITLSRAAELLDSSVHRVHRLARERGIETGSTPEEYERSVRVARELL